ncbi:EXS-domain-containing protein [Glonium stellatum]|uniref:EXS-domain-containing protein n=1 Tax=Glonium stellatum TaxID=574774 RepID=A0A8E2FBZ2_9PEZI|nr:EXS-domain-containing protein [Glonium stellatum]
MWGESQDAYEQVYNGDDQNKSSWGHELVAGGAAFAGFKAFEDHQRKEGKPVSHQFAKELLAGFAGAEVDKLAETKGEDFFDKEKAKHQAKQRAEQMYDDHYINNQGADQYDPNQELERDLVPEWRAKYLDYKQGKKKLKAIARALRNVSQTPRSYRRGTTATPSPFDTAPRHSFLNQALPRLETHGDDATQDLRALAMRNSRSNLRANASANESSAPQDIPHSNPEERPLRGARDEVPQMTRYGSIIGSPSNNAIDLDTRGRKPPELELPDPAMDPDHPSAKPSPLSRAPSGRKGLNATFSLPENNGDAFRVGKTRSPHRQSATLPPRYKGIFKPKRINSMPAVDKQRPLIQRMFSINGKETPDSQGNYDLPLEAFREVDFRQTEFFVFLDGELEKIETFYKQKEDEATDRLNILREQLHIMRDRRLDEIMTIQIAKKAKQGKAVPAENPLLNDQNASSDEDQSEMKRSKLNLTWLKPLDSALAVARNGHFGKTTKGMKDLGTPSALRPRQMPDAGRDYTRRPDLQEVPYRSAKRKLKVALQEYYRGLELLKSYALLNRTAFRKINKKHDKTINARPSGRYMAEKVNKAWFVQSEVLDGYIRAVEDLYARYFEQGNHKVAVGKLRVKAGRVGDFTENSFHNGLLVAGGLVFGVQGLVHGAELLFSSDPTLATNTSYLLQNIELFFCLYAHHWTDPSKCNSSNSRLLGFFSALPGIWRALQCVRRYYDTRNAFPHLANCGKYTATILYYTTLSIYRIEKTTQHKALFISFATINAIYCSIWDVVMDWSLGDPYARNRFLRDTLGYKKVWMYYVAMVVDPILRFNWIFYAIYIKDVQHSAVLSFLLAFSEIFRRGMWTLFRVENEHCTNVGRFRASRDVPLPYDIPSAMTSPSSFTRPSTGVPPQAQPAATPSPELQRTPTFASALTPARTRDTTTSTRHRARHAVTKQPSPMVRGLSHVGTLLHAAHAQDFERKRRPGVGADDGGDEFSDEEEEEEEERRVVEGEGGEEVEEASGRVGTDEESSIGMVARAEDVIGEEDEGELNPGEDVGR